MSMVIGFAMSAGCGDAAAPTVDSVSGSYGATVFTVEEGPEPEEDLLAQGALINVTLRADGSTSGRLFVPGGGENGADFDADLTGTWALTNGAINLDHVADTFLRDMLLTVDGERLRGQQTFGSAAITLELTKQ